MRISLEWARRHLGLVLRLVAVAGGLAVLVVVIAWLSGMFMPKIEPGRTSPEGPRVGDRPTAVVEERTLEYGEQAIGSLKSSSRMIVAAKLLATIDDVTVKAGDQVRAGDLLVQLDSEEFLTRLDQSQQALAIATSTHDKAVKDFERAQTLVGQDAITTAAFEAAERDLAIATAEKNRATQAVAEAQVQLSYTAIRAAKDGRIVDRLSEPGDLAKPGEPLLVLYDATSLRIEAPVPERLAVRLRVGDRLTCRIDAVDREVPAVVDEIVPQADAPSRSMLVKASVPYAEDLFENMFGRLMIPVGARRHLCLDPAAIVHIGQLEFVDVVREDGSLERRLIKTGTLDLSDRVEVLSGLAAAERVVLQGPATRASDTTVESPAAASTSVESAAAEATPADPASDEGER